MRNRWSILQQLGNLTTGTEYKKNILETESLRSTAGQSSLGRKKKAKTVSQ